MIFQSFHLLCLLIDVLKGSGNAFVGLKENAFEPSSPIRHMAELNHLLTPHSDFRQKSSSASLYGWRP